MLDHWMVRLRDRDSADAGKAAQDAANYAAWVLTLPVRPETKAKAHFVLALARRNLLDYAAARTDLDKALAGPERPADAAWRAEARKLQGELTDAAGYRRRFETLRAGGHLGRALAEIGAQIKVASGKEQGSWLAMSSLTRLEQALQSGKPLTAMTPEVMAARKEAEEAVAKQAEPEGHFALGRIDEVVGDLEGAAKHYAIAAKYQGNKELASMYRLALARILLKTKPVSMEKKKEDRKPPQKTKAPGRREAIDRMTLVKQVLSARGDRARSSALLFLLSTVLLSADADANAGVDVNPNVDRAIQLAREAIELGDPRGHLILGIALTQKGEWTKGLMEYITGLEQVCPGDETRGLRSLVEEHPAFHTADSVKPPQPLLAEKHFARGLNYFWAHQYAKAEAEFLETVKFFGKDARYHYFLGLAGLLQNNPAKLGAAFESFRQGKRLEDEGNPDTYDVDASLEKVQGKPRQALTRFRKP
jgi:tetratricopeptide (TPR) repeat protein